MNEFNGGYAFDGQSIGILMLDAKYPLIPGNVGNALSYKFPVRYRVMKGMPSDWWCDKEGASERRREIFIQEAMELEKEGVKAITTGCGFFAKYQKEAARSLTAPIFCSPLLMVPMISKMIGPDRLVGVISAGANHLKGGVLENVGIDSSIPLVVDGMDDQVEFNDVIVFERKKTLNALKMEAELVAVARRMVERRPEIGAIVFECSDLPPFASAVYEAVGRPVFDFIKFVELVHSSVAPRRYSSGLGQGHHG
jgi:aspartate/glutamate racemase